jgi:putative peptidoglycan lipid II flippase
MFRDTLVVAVGTLMSRLTGLLRVVIFGIVIGQTALADAFDGANNSPNSIYELLLGGVLAAGLVPLFTRFEETKDDDARSAVISVSVVLLLAATVVAIIAAPFIFRLFSLSPSSLVDTDEFRRAGTAMTRIFLVQIFFYGVTAIGSALLNARRRFMAAAWAPVVSNVVSISFLLLIPLTINGTPQLSDITDSGAFFVLLSLSTTLGVAAMALMLLPAIRRADISWNFRPDFRHPAVKRLFQLSLWSFGYVVTNQIALIVVRNLADPGSGNQDAYGKAFIFFMLPHGLLAISIATTFAPELVRRVQSHDHAGFREWITSGTRWTIMLTLPASITFVLLAHPLINALLTYGQFSDAAANNTARALMGFAVGLVGFSVYLFALRGFYAHEDTRTPFLINVVENAINIVLAIILVDRHGVLGLGLAFGIAYLISSVIVLVVLSVRHNAVNWSSLASLAIRAVSAVAAMGVVIALIETAMSPQSGLGYVCEVLLAGLAGTATYVILAVVFGIPEIRHIQRVFVRRNNQTNDVYL